MLQDCLKAKDVEVMKVQSSFNDQQAVFTQDYESKIAQFEHTCSKLQQRIDEITLKFDRVTEEKEQLETECHSAQTRVLEALEV